MSVFRAHCAAATVLMLFVSTVGPSAAAAAELIRGITSCSTTPGGCPLPSDPGAATGALPGTSNLAGGLPSSATTPAITAAGLPSSTLLTGTSLPGSSVTTGGTGTGTLPATTTNPALPRSTVTPLPPSVPNPPSSNRPNPDRTEGQNDVTDPNGNSGTDLPPSNVNTDGTRTAAQTLNWGNPQRVENFDAGLANWGVYNGTGHNNQGRRSPAQAAVAGGVLTMSGDANGNTAGMAWNFGAKYGRWEVRVKAPVADPSYHAVSLLWPDAENWPVGGEVDFAEMSDPSRQTTDSFLHYGAQNNQVHGAVNIDATQWHNWAVQWSPTAITYYVDGVQWGPTIAAAMLPPGSMHLCLQLDWFPSGGAVRPSQMQVDWAAFYPINGSGQQTTSPTATPTTSAIPTPTTSATPTTSSTPTSSATPTPTTTSTRPTTSTAKPTTSNPTTSKPTTSAAGSTSVTTTPPAVPTATG